MSRTLDFRWQEWGHAIHGVRVGERVIKPPFLRRLFGAKSESVPLLTCMGHSTPKPSEGDVLLIPARTGKVVRWRVVETRWIGDPRDMFDVRRADFDGYLDNEGTEA